jgi:hypothetical protein
MEAGTIQVPNYKPVRGAPVTITTHETLTLKKPKLSITTHPEETIKKSIAPEPKKPENRQIPEKAQQAPVSFPSQKTTAASNQYLPTISEGPVIAEEFYTPKSPEPKDTYKPKTTVATKGSSWTQLLAKSVTAGILNAYTTLKNYSVYWKTKPAEPKATEMPASQQKINGPRHILKVIPPRKEFQLKKSTTLR